MSVATFPELVRSGLGPLCPACGACLGRADPLPPCSSSVGEAERAHPAPVFSVRLRAGQVLYQAGQLGDAVFALHGGLVKESLEAHDGERVVRLIGASGVTGLAALLGEPHRHSARVVGDGMACRIPVTRLRERLGHEPASAFTLLAHWQGALDDVDRVIAAFGCGSARARLARYILFLLEALGEQARLRRQEAAELIGVTPVSVTRLIGEFKRDGLVREEGLRLQGCDRQRLSALAANVRMPGARPPRRL